MLRENDPKRRGEVLAELEAIEGELPNGARELDAHEAERVTGGVKLPPTGRGGQPSRTVGPTRHR